MKGRPDDPQELMPVIAPLAQLPIGDTLRRRPPITGRPEVLVPAIRATVARHDPHVPVRRIRTLEDLSEQATAGYRFRAVTVATFAGLALVLAMVGVFGVLAYSVEQRGRELGVRIALGATTTNVLTLVLGGATRVIVAGVVIGLATAAMLARSISTFLYGVQPLDPVTFGSGAVVVALDRSLRDGRPGPACRTARPAGHTSWRVMKLNGSMEPVSHTGFEPTIEAVRGARSASNDYSRTVAQGLPIRACGFRIPAALHVG